MNLTLDLAKIALLGASGWLVAALLARGPASARHDLWLLVLLGAVLVPAAELLLPPLYVIVPATWEPPGQPPFVLGLWALGALVWAARLAPGLVALRRIARAGERWSDPAALAALAAAARLAGERACEEAVIATGARASDYCGHLVEIMRAATRGARGAVIGATMAAPCTLERRVRALLASPGPAPVRSHSGVPLVLVGLLLI